ncbi:MAG: RNA-directed DNA polymerase, partial [Flavobacterium sp.]
MSQYDEFLSVSNFELAYTRLKTASRNLYKSIYYDDLRNFGLFLDDNILNTINHIKQGIYQPEKCHKIFIPKKDNLVRPLSMLTFIDQLVYQALTNIIADHSYDIISPYYNSVIFGNIVNTSKANKNDRKFFFKPWKQRWKRFNEVSKGFHQNGFKYLSEFDIASFFDTIDHNILCELLRNTYKIEDEILQLLCRCLETWTQDSNHKSFKSKHGIPQGPLASPFLADLYLFYLDNEILNSKKLTFRYVRYVDDIRLFTKDRLTSQKLIALLDLVSRDLGLIPQGSKIIIKEIKDIDKELKLQNSKFSDINKEYNKETDGKPPKLLTSKTHKRLKRRFLNCFNDKSEEVYLDKTLIGFALYKLNKDDEVKNLLLEKYKLILPNFEGVLFYFSKHYNIDDNVINFCRSLIKDENILFHHLVALVFKYFPQIPFDEEVYAFYNFQTHRHWLVNYYMVQWLYENDKKDVLLMSADADNH